jgi:methylthioribose-1-phosphate isomerase
MSAFHTIEWIDGRVRMLDQRYLPHKILYNDYTDYNEVADAIREMVIRGAPALGAAAAYGMTLVPFHTHSQDVQTVRQELQQAARTLRQARPTAVNLAWGVDRILKRLADPKLDSVEALREASLDEALAIAQEDVQTNKKLGLNALPLIPDEATIIHHCNTGTLATVDYGTALGVIRAAHENGKRVFVLVDETRPRLQGARLTAWELQQYGIPFKVIVDGASGHYMRTLGVDLCVVGCDRVAANGDAANKIGTYNLAVVAHENGVPFYVAAPSSTIDMRTPNGDKIKIEERPAREVTHVSEVQITPQDTLVGNPAFDVTPAKYISAILTELGIAYPPFEKSLAKLMSNEMY